MCESFLVQWFPAVCTSRAILRLLISRPYVSNWEYSIVYSSDLGINEAEEKSQVIVSLLYSNTSLNLVEIFVNVSFIITDKSGKLFPELTFRRLLKYTKL
jgi:hypothetical protein